MSNLQTKALFPGWYSEFKEDDEYFNEPVLVEVVDVDEQEIEIAFSASGYREYVRFRMKDLLRCVKEFSEASK